MEKAPIELKLGKHSSRNRNKPHTNSQPFTTYPPPFIAHRNNRVKSEIKLPKRNVTCLIWVDHNLIFVGVVRGWKCCGGKCLEAGGNEVSSWRYESGQEGAEYAVNFRFPVLDRS